MKIQVSSLNGHDWSNYREKLLCAAREAKRATSESDYAMVLAIVKSNQRPNDMYKRNCLTQWQFQVGKQLQKAVENDKTMACEKAARRVGEEGEKSHGKVDEEAVAARGPGTKTTDLQADGVSLTTPASCPRDDKVALTKIPPVESQNPPDTGTSPSRETDETRVANERVETAGRAVEVERSESVAHECADAGTDGTAEEAQGDAQVEVESATMQRMALTTGVSGCVSAHVRSTTTVEENDQRPSTDDEDIPGLYPDPLAPPLPPDKPAQCRNNPPSVKLEGEKRLQSSFHVRPTSAGADVSEASGASGSVEDATNVPKNARNASERKRKHSKRRS